LSPAGHEDLCQFLYDASAYGFIVRTVEAPFFRRVVTARRAGAPAPDSPLYQRLTAHLTRLLGPPASRPSAHTAPTRDGKGSAAGPGLVPTPPAATRSVQTQPALTNPAPGAGRRQRRTPRRTDTAEGSPRLPNVDSSSDQGPWRNGPRDQGLDPILSGEAGKMTCWPLFYMLRVVARYFADPVAGTDQQD
jgi:hypothetical protein